MNNFFNKLNVACLNDHFDILGGGTVHSFKLIEYLKKYYNVDVYIPGQPKSKEWMDNFLKLNIDGLTFHQYAKGCGNKNDYLFLNISHWKAEETNAFKKFMLVFFPQFYFPVYDYNFIANSEYTKQKIIERWKQDETKIKVNYPPIMTDNFEVREKKNYILHVSRVTPPAPEADKGHRQMIQSFKEMVDSGLKNWEFHLVGQIQDNNYYEELVKMAQGYPIKFHTGISFNELKKLYSESSIYWHITGITKPDEPGAQEHFGMTTCESMASGCVPVVLATGGQPEIVKNGKNGFLINNLNELKEATNELIKSPSMLKDMSEEAIERSKYFDDKKIQQEFYNIIAKTNKVSIIIVCWNNSQFTKDCIERLYEVTPTGFELIIVNNASTDNTLEVLNKLKEKYPDIKIINSEENLGFAKGNNLGLKEVSGEYICFLNNDTLPQWGWLERMVDVMETKEDAGVVGGRLYFSEKNGKWLIQHAGVEFINGETEHIGRFKEDSMVRGVGIQEVEAVTGACMLVRKEFAKFDEEYIRGYYEDVDLCMEVRKAGKKVYINHEAKLIHYEGQSQNIVKQNDKKKFDEVAENNKKRFHKKWDEEMKNFTKVKEEFDLSGTNNDSKVEIGGGEKPLYPDYGQVDLRKLPNIKYNCDARLLPFASNSLSDICASYILQCFDKKNSEIALREWLRCLKHGGKLEIYVPDMDKISKKILTATDSDWFDYVYGSQTNVVDYYQSGYSFKSLDVLLSKIGFVRVTSLKPNKLHEESLGVEAFKP